MNNTIIRDYNDTDFAAVHKILNHFITDSFAAYPEELLKRNRLKQLMTPAKITLVIQKEKLIIGFGYVSEFKPLPNFSHTGLLTYFILPEYTGKGLGTKLFNKLIERGKELGVTNYLAHISSLNQQSLNFHIKHGFEEAGRFKNVAVKFGKEFDIVWMQKQFNGGAE